MKKTYLPRGN